MEPIISVIIVNYNVKFFLEQCLHSVCKAASSTGVEVIVVDNHSTDGSREYLAPLFPQVKFIWNADNPGFARACNQGLRDSHGRYILFLNPDTILPEDCFEKCLQFFESRPHAGALGARMLDGSGKFLKESKRSFPSPSTSFFKLTGLAALFPHSRFFARYHLGHLDAHEDHEVDVLAGAFMMIRREVLDQVGPFDESFFMYGEDIDLSFRIKEAGYKNYYLAGVSILHFKGESSRKGSLNYVRLFYSAMSKYVTKHYGASKAGLFNFFIQVSIGLRALLSAFGRFIRWIGLPVLDAALILLSFYLMKMIWSEYFLRHEGYNMAMLRIAFPVFTVIFMIAAYYAGLYDIPFRYHKLVRASALATVVLLAVYSLLPERYRFSRAIVLLAPVAALGFMIILRWMLTRLKLIDKSDEDSEFRRTIVIGSQMEYDHVVELMRNADLEGRVLGRIAKQANEPGAMGTSSDLEPVLRATSPREIIFCEGEHSFSYIIETMQHLPKGIRCRIHARDTHSIVGSDFRNTAGETISPERRFRLGQPGPMRMKRLADLLLSICFCLSFPLHFFLQKRPLVFWNNVFQVMIARKSWVGYASRALRLPPLRPGVIACNGLPGSMNQLPEESLYKLDLEYAQNYSARYDLVLVWKCYKNLGAENGEL